MVVIFSKIFPPGSASTIWFLVLLLYFFWSSSMPQCVKECNRIFATEGSLSRHRQNCPALAVVRARSREVRRDKGMGRSQTVPTLFSRKERLQAYLTCSAPAEGPSQTSAAMDVDTPESEGTIRAIRDMSIQDSDMCDSPTRSHGPTITPTSAHPDLPSNTQDDELSTLTQLPLLTQSGRPRREYRLPKRFRDNIPEPPAPVPTTGIPPNPEPNPHPIRRVTLIVRDCLITAMNSFGIWRNYPERPTVDPDSVLTLEDLSNSHYNTYGTSSDSNSYPSEPRSPHWPFSNATVHAVMHWLNNGHTSKSEVETNKFVHDVILSPTFDPTDLAGFDAHRENQRIDKALSQESTLRSQFTESSVEILVPSGENNVEGRTFTVPGLLHRNLTSVIREAFETPLAHLYHYSPFKLFQKSPRTGKDERIYGEIFTSDAFLEETEAVRRHGLIPPDDPGCKREKAVAALMVSSDATMLTQFGVAKGWPIYLMFGNLSKYIRGQPGSGAMHHIAYIPSLPESIRDFISSFHPKWRSQKDKILTHCRRELMHAVWTKILDEDFLHAYTYGIVIKCVDGIERRIYPRFFTYSADYPEKVLLATIRDKGLTPCPRCLVPKAKLDQLGLARDMTIRVRQFRQYMADKVAAARRVIYELAKPITGAAVEAYLKEFSGVPTKNAFVERLGASFNPSNMLVVDLMHEFELGVWKTLFTHLVRLLYAAGNGTDRLVLELDRRYYQISTFGHGTIRRFPSNVSEMKKLAARDFEDILQCSIPAFEGLLEDHHNRRLMKLLYRISEWHALAKLRMHTEDSLGFMEETTKELGDLLRQFRNFTCSAFNTVELPREADARVRRKKDAIHTHSNAVPTAQSAPPPMATDSQNCDQNTTPESCVPPSLSNKDSSHGSRKPKVLNLLTVKLHFLGDYVRHIRIFGTTDSYSTQLGELAHRLIKRLYGLTNKKDAMKQIGKKYNRQEVLRSSANSSEAHEAKEAECKSHTLHHVISESRNSPVSLFDLVQTNSKDPAMKGFISKLKNHLLGRLRGHEFDGDTHQSFSDDDRNSIRIRNNTIYCLSTIRINYTTYDMRRDFDTVNPKTHPFIMVLSPETEKDAHPFWYASVLGVYHADVQYSGHDSRDFRYNRMEFLWVRWLGVVPGHRFGKKHAKLPKIGFIPDSDEFAFGFLDPAHPVRGCHLIPSFVDGKNRDLLSTEGPSLGRVGTQDDDWSNYYVGIFVDRDMFMRFLGIGIGHCNQPTEAEQVAGSDGSDLDSELMKDSDGDTDADNAEDDNCALDSDDEDEGSDLNSDDEEYDDDDVGYDDF